MKIGICGTHSVGKSTLLEAIKTKFYADEEIRDYKFITEITRKIKNMGVGINLDASDLSQTIITNQHIANLVMYDDFISDRCMVDGLAYTKFFYEKGKVSEEVFNYVQDAFHSSIGLYDGIIVIRPEFDLVDDGVRSTDKEFRDTVEQYIDDIVHDYSGFTHFEIIRGTVDQRVHQFFEFLKVFDE